LPSCCDVTAPVNCVVNEDLNQRQKCYIPTCSEVVDVITFIYVTSVHWLLNIHVLMYVCDLLSRRTRCLSVIAFKTNYIF
jgi:hypothetical protein